MNDPEIERIMREKMKKLMQSNIRIVDINGDNMHLLLSEKPIIVDFWAPWCAPCKYMHSIFERLASRYGDKIRFARVNVDENQLLAVKYEITAIPTLLLLIDGRIVERVIGLKSENELDGIIRRYIKE
ncbi:MAG: thioredoxin [Candidatus Nitrosocaldaceae archaeon]